MAVPRATAWSTEASVTRMRSGASLEATDLTISVAACGLAGQLWRLARPEGRQPSVTRTVVPSTSSQVSRVVWESKLGERRLVTSCMSGAGWSMPGVWTEESLRAMLMWNAKLGAFSSLRWVGRWVDWH